MKKLIKYIRTVFVPRKIKKIITGGQSGADRAGLDFAINNGIDYGGYVPYDGWTEDLEYSVCHKYPNLKDSGEKDVNVRTGLNVAISDATIIFRLDSKKSKGTDHTGEMVKKLNKPYFIFSKNDNIYDLLIWLKSLPNNLLLNIAGARESESKGIYDFTYKTLTELLTKHKEIK
jgi:hypothetical protein